MANDPQDFLKDVLAAPLGELISSVGAGVAEAQAALDAASLSQTLAIYDSVNDGNAVIQSLREIGYQPTFYTIPETEVEAQISLSLSYSEQSQQNSQGSSLSNLRIYTTPTNASVTNAFNMNIAASSKIKFKIVAVPPPASVQEAIQRVPNLVGLVTTPDAEDLLAEGAFKLAISNPSGNDAERKILSQTPEAGIYQLRGSTVTVVLEAVVVGGEGEEGGG